MSEDLDTSRAIRVCVAHADFCTGGRIVEEHVGKDGGLRGLVGRGSAALREQGAVACEDTQSTGRLAREGDGDVALAGPVEVPDGRTLGRQRAQCVVACDLEVGSGGAQHEHAVVGEIRTGGGDDDVGLLDSGCSGHVTDRDAGDRPGGGNGSEVPEAGVVPAVDAHDGRIGNDDLVLRPCRVVEHVAYSDEAWSRHEGRILRLQPGQVVVLKHRHVDRAARDQGLVATVAVDVAGRSHADGRGIGLARRIESLRRRLLARVDLCRTERRRDAGEGRDQLGDRRAAVSYSDSMSTARVSRRRGTGSTSAALRP